MSCKNFVPTLWSANIDTALKEYLVAADFTNQEYTGEVSAAGDSVRVQQAIRPPITTTSDGKPIDMSNPEDANGTSLTMPINMQSGFFYSVNNVDEAQAKGNLKSSLQEETTQGLANAVDKYILELVKDAAVKKSASTAITTSNILGTINAGLEHMYKNYVPANADIEIDISPAFHTVFLEAYSKLDTNNSEMIKNGIVGRYGNMNVKISSNIYNDGTDDFVVIRTKKAIAYAKPTTTTEALKNPNRLGDVVRGAILYGAKVMRPKEIYVIKAHV